MKQMFKKRLLLILFLATILVYVVALFWSIHNYQEWKRRDIERYLEKYPPEIVGFLEISRFDQTRQGKSMVQLGLAIGFVWVVGIGFLGKYMEHRDLRLLARIIPVLGFLCFVVGIMAFFYYEESSVFGVVAPYSDYIIPLMLLGIAFFAFSPVIWVHARNNRHTRRT